MYNATTGVFCEPCLLGVPEQYSHPRFKEAVKTIFSKARAAGVGASIHQIGRFFLLEKIISTSRHDDHES